MTAIDAHNLHVAAAGQPILTGIDLEVARGQVVGLIGPNGAGKTTLMRALLRLVALADGTIRLMGDDVTALPAHRLSRYGAYLPQAQNVHWPLSVERLVALGRQPAMTPFGRWCDADRRAVADALAATDLTALRHRPISNLSGGERARALLARVLAGNAPILFADEPVAALDPYHQLQVMELFARTAAAGRTVVLVLHDLSLAGRFCDRLVLLDRGRIAAAGPPETVLSTDNLARVYRVRVRRGDDGTITPLACLEGPR